MEMITMPQNLLDDFLKDFEFTYPKPFILQNEQFKVTGFASWDHENHKKEFQIVLNILKGNKTPFNYYKVVLAFNDPQTNLVNYVTFEGASPLDPLPENNTSCKLSIKLFAAPLRLVDKLCNAIKNGEDSQSLEILEIVRKRGKEAVYLLPQILYLANSGTTDQQIAAAHCLGNIDTEWGQEVLKRLGGDFAKAKLKKLPSLPAKDKDLVVDQPGKDIYKYNLPLELAATGIADWKWDEEQKVDGDHGEVSIAIGRHTPSSQVYLRTVTSRAFPQDMIAVYLKPQSKIPTFFIGLKLLNNQKIGKINLSDLLYLKVITDQFIKAPEFWILPFSLTEMNSNLKHLIANSRKSSHENLDPIFKRYYEHNQ